MIHNEITFSKDFNKCQSVLHSISLLCMKTKRDLWRLIADRKSEHNLRHFYLVKFEQNWDIPGISYEILWDDFSPGEKLLQKSCLTFSRIALYKKQEISGLKLFSDSQSATKSHLSHLKVILETTLSNRIAVYESWQIWSKLRFLIKLSET